MKQLLVVGLLGLTLVQTAMADQPPVRLSFNDRGAVAAAIPEGFVPRSVSVSPNMALYASLLPSSVTQIRFHVTIMNKASETEYSGWTRPFDRSAATSGAFTIDISHLSSELKPGSRVFVDGASHDIYKNICRTPSLNPQIGQLLVQRYSSCDDVPWSKFSYLIGTLEISEGPAAAPAAPASTASAPVSVPPAGASIQPAH